MKIFLTFDYELYFGEKTGTAFKCMVEPTNRLIEIAEKHGIKMTFFVDCGYLVAMEKVMSEHSLVELEYKQVKEQIKKLIALGHECQLHIHPHWEDSYYDGKRWIIDATRYKLSDFSEVEIDKIFTTYKASLEAITEQKVSVYRAGGWCIQPFSILKKVFEKHALKLDSSVFYNGYLESDSHYFDFRNVPDKEIWKFEEDVSLENENGKFIELPISSYLYPPLFFWKLYVLGRLFPSKHKAMGNGKAIAAKGMKRQYLTKAQELPISSDGYFASMLEVGMRLLKKKKYSRMVVIGHPKACTLFSLIKLERFVARKKYHHQFALLSSEV